jgi:hypothetical protein
MFLRPPVPECVAFRCTWTRPRLQKSCWRRKARRRSRTEYAQGCRGELPDAVEMKRAVLGPSTPQVSSQAKKPVPLRMTELKDR